MAGIALTFRDVRCRYTFWGLSGSIDVLSAHFRNDSARRSERLEPFSPAEMTNDGTPALDCSGPPGED